MTLRTKLLLGALALLTSFALGRFSTPETVKVETKTVQVDSKVDNTSTNQDKHQDTTTTTTKAPDGTVVTKTETVVDTNTHRQTRDTDTTDTSTDTSKEVTRSSSKLSISVLAGVNVTSPGATPVYGGSITRGLIGPLTVGLFGLSNGVVGASVGLTF